MNFKRPVLMIRLWLPRLLFLVVLLFYTLPGRHRSTNTPQRTPKPLVDTPRIAAKPPATLLFPETELLGKYFMGTNPGTNCYLTLTADHRFTFIWYGSVVWLDDKGHQHDSEHDRNLGTWEIQGDVAVMHPEKPNIRDGMRGMATRFVPVKWGERLYLVDENQMPAFCVAARHARPAQPGDEYTERRTVYYVREDGEKLAPLHGKPLLPERYMEFYRKGPVTAKVARIDAQGQVILNAGTANRVKTNMLFTDTTSYGIDLKVLSVRENEAVCKILYRWYSDERVKAGDACTTGTEEYVPDGIGSQEYNSPPDPLHLGAK